MKALWIALWLTVAGLALGLVGVGTEWLMDWAGDYVPGWVKVGLGLLLIAVAAVGLLWAAIVILVREPTPSDTERRLESLRDVGDMVADIPKEGPILASEDGSFVHARIRLPPDRWTQSLEFYDPGVAGYQIQARAEWVYYLFFRFSPGRTTVPIPFAAPGLSCRLTSVFEYAGFRRKLAQALNIVQGVLSEADGLGWIRTIGTTVCVFGMKFIWAQVNGKYNTFTDETLRNYVESGSKGPLAVPRGLALTQLEITFEVPGVPTLSPLLVELELDPPLAVLTTRRWVGHFQYFTVRPDAVLRLPYEED
ncbi:MAG TPA: hypothetical protein VH109_04245 [Steroidobacteraceae bacterium]|nr:hypothetical protein [Steroidobacteraceae bacterium]